LSAARRRRILEGTCRTADRRTAELNGRKIQGRRPLRQFGKKGHDTVSNDEEHDPLRLDASTHEHLWLNPRGVRQAPRKKVPYDGKPTLHAPGCKSIARTEESKPLKVPAMP
jgi:hypothetical protein